MFSYIQRFFVGSFLTRQVGDIQRVLESLDLVFGKTGSFQIFRIATL
jgi:hypothetical protein